MLYLLLPASLWNSAAQIICYFINLHRSFYIKTSKSLALQNIFFFYDLLTCIEENGSPDIQTAPPAGLISDCD